MLMFGGGGVSFRPPVKSPQLSVSPAGIFHRESERQGIHTMPHSWLGLNRQLWDLGQRLQRLPHTHPHTTSPFSPRCPAFLQSFKGHCAQRCCLCGLTGAQPNKAATLFGACGVCNICFHSNSRSHVKWKRLHKHNWSWRVNCLISLLSDCVSRCEDLASVTSSHEWESILASFLPACWLSIIYTPQMLSWLHLAWGPIYSYLRYLHKREGQA